MNPPNQEITPPQMMEFDPTLVHQWLDRSARKYPDKPAIVCGQETLTYRQLSQYSDRLAKRLLLSGLSCGDRVAIFLENSAETVISLYAALKAGGIFVVLNGQLKPGKLAYILDNSEARFLITAPQKGRVIQNALAKTDTTPGVIFTTTNEQIREHFPDSLDFQSLISEEPDSASLRPAPRVIDQDLAALIYTSGSTGEPKGVMSSHRNMVSAARSVIQYIQNEPDDIILNVLPLSFDYGLYQVLMSVMFGGTVVVEKSFMYSHQILTKISEYKVTGFPIVPTIVAMLLNMQDLDKYDFSSLRYITNTGAALPA